MKRIFEEPCIEVIKLMSMEKITDDLDIGGDGVGAGSEGVVEDF